MVTMADGCPLCGGTEVRSFNEYGPRCLAGDYHITLIYKRVLISELIERGGMDHPVVRAVREGEALAISVEAVGPRARLRPEVLGGLRGEGPGEGLHGHWVQAYYVHLFVHDAGGRVFADLQPERVVFAATLPA